MSRNIPQIPRPSRRTLLGLPLVLAAAAPAAAAVRRGEDGLFLQDWYLDSFLDLAEDATAAATEGKHFAVEWGQRGCPFCKTLHTVYFADPAIETPIRAAFVIVHLDLNGAREVTGIDGRASSEKALAARSGVRLTPTFQFFAERDGAIAEVARMPGLLDERDFSAFFRYVADGGWQTGPFDAWLDAQPPAGG
jgi:thioredoxin-related protein